MKRLTRLACLVSVALVLATAALKWVPIRSGLGQILFWLDLGHENNAASWWSGTLFLLAATRAFDRGVNRAHALDALGWWSVALLSFLLSFDEVGSLHARLPSDWWLFVPFALLAMTSVSALLARRDPRVRPLIIALGALFCAAVFDRAQDHAWKPGVFHFFPVAIEEGLELVTALLLVRTAWSRTNDEPGGDAPFLSLLTSRLGGATEPGFLALPALAISGFALAPLMAWWTARLWDQFRGHPADWFALVFTTWGALLALRPALARRVRPSIRALAQATACALLGLFIVIPLHFPAMGRHPVPVNLRPPVIGLLLLVLAGALRRRTARWGLALIAILLALAPGRHPGWFGVYIIGALAGVAAFAAIAAIGWEEEG